MSCGKSKGERAKNIISTSLEMSLRVRAMHGIWTRRRKPDHIYEELLVSMYRSELHLSWNPLPNTPFWRQRLIQETPSKLHLGCLWQYQTPTSTGCRIVPNAHFKFWKTTEGVRGVFDYNTASFLLSIILPKCKLHCWKEKRKGAQDFHKMIGKGESRQNSHPYSPRCWYAVCLRGNKALSTRSHARRIFVWAMKAAGCRVKTFQKICFLLLIKRSSSCRLMLRPKNAPRIHWWNVAANSH
jgi:hypothetical protein